MKLITFFFFLLLSNLMNSQTIEISLKLDNNCLDNSRQTNNIQITATNNSNKGIWIDLSAINFTIHHSDGKLVEPIETDFVGLDVHEGSKPKNGFIFISSKTTIIISRYTSLFKNYQFEIDKTYYLKGYYCNVRKNILKKIYDIECQVCDIEFSICG